MKRVPSDAESSRASNRVEAPPAHSASIEFELAEGRPVGSIALDGGHPATFEGFAELERLIASFTSAQRSLVLVRSEDRPAPENGLEELTRREREIAIAAAGGASNREIADSLFYSVKSIEAYLTRAYRKLEISGRGELATLLDSGQPGEVEDLEVPERLGAELSGGRPGAPAGGGSPRQRVELLILPRPAGPEGSASAPG